MTLFLLPAPFARILLWPRGDKWPVTNAWFLLVLAKLSSVPTGYRVQDQYLRRAWVLHSIHSSLVNNFPVDWRLSDYRTVHSTTVLRTVLSNGQVLGTQHAIDAPKPFLRSYFGYHYIRPSETRELINLLIFATIPIKRVSDLALWEEERERFWCRSWLWVLLALSTDRLRS